MILARLLLFLCVAFSARYTFAGEVEWKTHADAGRAASERGDYRAAVTQHEAAVKEARGFGTEDIRFLTSEWYLASGRAALGDYAEAERIFRRLLEIAERKFGTEHEHIASVLGGLASVYVRQGRYVEADALYKRAIAVRERALGENHLDFAEVLYSSAEVSVQLARYSEAEALLKRALTVAEKTLSADDPSYALGLNRLAWVYTLEKRDAEAEQLIKRTLAIWEKAYGPEHPKVASAMGVLGWLYIKARRYAEAEVLLERIVPIYEKAYGLEHPDVATALNNLAFLYEKQGRISSALDASRRATPILTKRFAMGNFSERLGVVAEQRTRSFGFEQHVKMLFAINATTSMTPNEGVLNVEEAFEVAQLARASDTAEQVARMAARYAAGNDVLAQITRQRQDLAAIWESIDATLLREAAKPTSQRAATVETVLRDKQARALAEIADLDVRLKRDYPQYGDLTNPKPISLATVRNLLSADEALVVYVATFDGCFVWVVRKNTFQFSRLRVTRQTLDESVRKLRAQLDPSITEPERILSKLFDVVAAHQLYKDILADAEPLLVGVRHLIVVPDGALQSLPLGILVTEPRAKPLTSPDEYSDVAWLVKKYAITTLPAVNSLQALRAFAKGAPASEPFSGFGDPVLEGQGVGERRAGIATFFARGPVADVNEVRKLEQLPETASELKAIAASLKATDGSLYLGNRATEAQVKGLDLRRYRNLAFATHGLMSGDFKGLAEPALVLTPPKEGTEKDDGLLTASEISQLKLNADWVILSACNTASADGTPGAEGFSGLAKAFFYAGARSLLVSHWAVPSESTVALTTGMFAAYTKGASKAEALRRSMLTLMQRRDKPQFAHPMFWAPFVVVGEGNAEWAVGR